MFPDGLQTGHVLRHVPDVAGAERCARLQDPNTAHISGVSLTTHEGNRKAFQSKANEYTTLWTDPRGLAGVGDRRRGGRVGVPNEHV